MSTKELLKFDDSTIPMTPITYVQTLEQRIYQQAQRIKKLEKALNKTLTKKSTLKIQKIQDIVKKTKYTKKPFKSLKYWQLNSPENEIKINQNLIAERSKIINPKNGKYIEFMCYNYISSWEDIRRKIWDIYKKRSNAYKINVAFGYITENIDTGEVRFLQPRKYYFNSPPVVRTESHATALLNDLSK